MTTYSFHTMKISTDTFAGNVFSVLAEGDVVRASGFTDDLAWLARLAKIDPASVEVVGPDAPTHPALTAAARYFAGDFGALDSVQAMEAVAPSPFRQAARDALRKIPAGETRTYTQLAAAAGNPGAVRAAASGCATNPLTLFVPCHRVLRTDGALGGFLFGLDLKHRLICHERIAAIAP
jgi:methylated-DNA-[protein]-cysteine S-methyltransferase